MHRGCTCRLSVVAFAATFARRNTPAHSCRSAIASCIRTSIRCYHAWPSRPSAKLEHEGLPIQVPVCLRTNTGCTALRRRGMQQRVWHIHAKAAAMTVWHLYEGLVFVPVLAEIGSRLAHAPQLDGCHVISPARHVATIVRLAMTHSFGPHRSDITSCAHKRRGRASAIFRHMSTLKLARMASSSS